MKRDIGDVLAVAVIAAFLILGLVKFYPFKSDLMAALESDPGDDWWTYAKYGLEIVDNGVLMPSFKGPYVCPGSFLYCYFVAFFFFLFGKSAIPVYIAHYLLMGLAVAVTYWTFREKMRPFTGIAFLGALSLFTLLDVSKYYAGRLLGENLLFFVVPLFFFCFIRGFEKDVLRLQLASASLLGAIILLRTNTLIFAWAVIPCAAFYYLRKRPRRISHLALFLIFFAVAASLLAIRNYIICGKGYFLPRGGLSEGDNFIYFAFPVPHGLSILEYIFRTPFAFFGHLAKKILFCFGFTTFLSVSYRWRPHWMLMWLGYFIYLYLRFSKQRKIELWELVTHLYIVCYYGPLILIAQIHNYGFRMLIPATNFVLLFAFLAFDRLLEKREALMCGS